MSTRAAAHLIAATVVWSSDGLGKPALGIRLLSLKDSFIAEEGCEPRKRWEEPDSFIGSST